MADNDTTITVRVDDQGALKFFDALGKEIRHVESEAESATKGGIGTFTAAVAGFAGGVGAQLVSSLGGLALSFLDVSNAAAALKQGSAIDDVSSAFDTLASKAGAVSDIFINQLNEATANTISNFDLMKRANESLRAGIKPDEMVTLTKAARVLSEQTGGDLAESINKTTQAFITGRTRALENSLGIIDVNEAQKDLAAQLGITTADLSEQQKVLAARTAILAAAAEKDSEFNSIQKDMGDAIEGVEKAFSDQRNEALKAIANNEDLRDAILDLGEALRDLDLKPLINFLSSVISLGVNAAVSVNKLVKALGGLEEIARFLVPALGPLVDVMAYLAGPESSRGVASSLKLGEAIGQIEKAGRKAGSGLDDLVNGSKKGEDAAKKLEDSLKEVSKAVDAIVKFDRFPTLTQNIKDAYAGASSLESIELAVTLNEIGIAAAAAGIPVDEFSKRLSEIGGAARKAGDEAKKNMESIAEEAARAAKEIQTKIGTAIAGGLEDLFNGDIKSGFKSIAGDLGSLGGRQLGQTYGGPIGAEIGAQLGQILGEKLVDGIASLFGSDSAGTTFRKSVDKFFADAFDANRLLVIIDGQLQAIKDLDLGGADFGNAGAGFFDALKNLSPEAQSAFNGVALGFAGLQEDGIEFATNLAAALTNNVGGSLNNLQLLVQASGKSFEELRGTVVEAFLDGQLSALEAQTALQGLQNIAEDGIPGALGAAGEAFENLVAASEKGGRASTDALRDIGAEAKELGIKTIPQLISFLVNTAGKSSEAVQQVMSSLATFGIDSIDEIASATDEQLIPVLANLQANGFDFAEAAGNVEELTSQLESLPASKDVTINVRVKTTQEEAKVLNNAVSVQGSSGRDFFGSAVQ